jgi:DNA-binding IclR family transcriptional regulator
MENSKKIMEALAASGQPMKAAEIAEATGIDKKEIDKTIKKLVTEGQLHQPKRCFYAAN